MNLSSSGMMSTFKVDPNSRRLSQSVTTTTSTFVPLPKEITSYHEIDKQGEDNATWMFEYRALLNSKLTTLTTSLTSAYTTDLDAAMGANPATWGGKNAMQGLTGVKDTSGTTIIDPGAARTAFAYFSTYGGVAVTGNWSGNATLPAGEGTTVSLTYTPGSASYTYTYGAPVNTVTVTGPTAATTIGGTTTFLSGSAANFVLDYLFVDISNTPKNSYLNTVGPKVPSIIPEVQYQNKRIGNNFQKTLYEFFSKSENVDILRFGLFKDIFIVGTSSLPTGSQVQGSLSLNWAIDSPTSPAKITIKQERFAAFFHS